MALTRHITTHEPIPHEPGQWMEFRALNWVERAQAKRERSKEQLAGLRDLGGEMLQVFIGLKTEADTDATLADPFEHYDQGTLLRAGIVAWSYTEPVTAEHVNDLDEPTALWAARQILELSGVGRDPTPSSSS